MNKINPILQHPVKFIGYLDNPKHFKAVAVKTLKASTWIVALATLFGMIYVGKFLTNFSAGYALLGIVFEAILLFVGFVIGQLLWIRADHMSQVPDSTDYLVAKLASVYIKLGCEIAAVSYFTYFLALGFLAWIQNSFLGGLGSIGMGVLFSVSVLLSGHFASCLLGMFRDNVIANKKSADPTSLEKNE